MLIRCMSLATVFVFALVSPNPASAGTPRQQAPTHPRPGNGCAKKKTLKPSSWRQRFQLAYTKATKVTAKILTWDGQAPRRAAGGDPYQGQFTGYRDGTTITVKALRGQETFVPPTTKAKTAAKPAEGPGQSVQQDGKERQQQAPTQVAEAQTEVKPLSRTAKRRWRRAYSEAERWEHLGMARNVDGKILVGLHQAEFRIRRSSPGQEVVQSEAIPARLASHMPLRVFGKHEASGRNYPTIETNAIGSPERPQQGRQNGTLTPMNYAELSTLTHFENVHYSPLGAQSSDGSQSIKILGMAAYPPGAEIRVSNPGTGEQAEPFTAGSKQGGDFTTLSVTAEHRLLRVDVIYQGKTDKDEMSRTVHLTRYLYVPKEVPAPSWTTVRTAKKPRAARETAQKGGAEEGQAKARRISYYRPSLVGLPEIVRQPPRADMIPQIAFDGTAKVPQILVTPALKARGEAPGTPGKMTLRWKPEAFVEGTVVTFSNPRFPNEAISRVIHKEMAREVTLNAFADDPHLVVTLTHPTDYRAPEGADSVTGIHSRSGQGVYRLSMPITEGPPTEMGIVGDQRVPFYVANTQQ